MKAQVALIQFQPDKGNLSGNLQKIATCIKEAVAAGADLVLFPESAVSGYILEGGVDELCVSPQELVDRLTPELGHLSKPVDIVIGFYEKTQSRPCNSAIYLQIDGEQVIIAHVYRKLFLPTYGVFDEGRFQQEGNELGIVETRFGKVGLLICEDVWHSVMGSILAAAGADMILVLTATPTRGLSQEKPSNVIRYERMLKSLAEEHGMFVAMAMLVGFEGGKGLSGGSLVYSPFGDILVQAEGFGEQIVMGEFDSEDVRHARALTPLHSDLLERWEDVVRLAQGQIQSGPED